MKRVASIQGPSFSTEPSLPSAMTRKEWLASDERAAIVARVTTDPRWIEARRLLDDLRNDLRA